MKIISSVGGIETSLNETSGSESTSYSDSSAKNDGLVPVDEESRRSPANSDVDFEASLNIPGRSN